MPKEITHFLIAKKVCDLLEESPFWGPHVRREDNDNKS
jgi:hypothetical protein